MEGRGSLLPAGGDHPTVPGASPGVLAFLLQRSPLPGPRAPEAAPSSAPRTRRDVGWGPEQTWGSVPAAPGRPALALCVGSAPPSAGTRPPAALREEETGGQVPREAASAPHRAPKGTPSSAGALQARRGGGAQGRQCLRHPPEFAEPPLRGVRVSFSLQNLSGAAGGDWPRPDADPAATPGQRCAGFSLKPTSYQREIFIRQHRLPEARRFSTIQFY